MRRIRPRQRRIFQAILSVILGAQFREPLGESLGSFERQVHAYEDQSGKPILVEIFAITVIGGIDNATTEQRLQADHS